MASASSKLSTSLVSRPHLRAPWGDPGSVNALVHAKLEDVKGTKDLNDIFLYTAAKTENDIARAFDVVDRWYSDAVEDSLVDLIVAAGIRPIIAFPHPAFNDEDGVDRDAAHRWSASNALPFALAETLVRRIGGEKDLDIVQSARVGRTILKRMPRFLFQPSFEGPVSKDLPYVLIDDTYTLGGTLAALRSYIIQQGGSVVGIMALAHSTGQNQKFALTDHTSQALYRAYGPDFNDFWKEAIGHEYVCLTEGEGTFLAHWAAQNCRGLRDPDARLHALRARLNKARATCE